MATLIDRMRRLLGLEHLPPLGESVLANAHPEDSKLHVSGVVPVAVAQRSLEDTFGQLVAQPHSDITALQPVNGLKPPVSGVSPSPQIPPTDGRIASSVHNLVLRGERQLDFPAELRLAGSFRLEGGHITRLPEVIVVGEDIRIGGRPRVRRLSRVLEAGRDIVVEQMQVDAFPERVRANHMFRLTRSPNLEEFPHFDLDVGQVLDLSHNRRLRRIIGPLPKCRELIIRDCPVLTKLPDGLEVEWMLNLSGCQSLANLPLRLKVHPPGSRPRPPALNLTPVLNLWGCVALTALPDDITIDGLIEVAGSGLTSLPLHLDVSDVLFRGMRVPADLVFHPERLSPRRILDERNAEARRFALERVGVQHVLEGAGAILIHEDEDPGGPRRLWRIPNPSQGTSRQQFLDEDPGGHTRLWRPPNPGQNTSRQQFLECRCPSTGRRYLLQVSLDVRTCHEAAAWIAGLDPEHYQPVIET